MSQISDKISRQAGVKVIRNTSTVTVSDNGNVLSSLQSGDPITMRDAVLQPISSQKRQKLLDNVAYLEAQCGRLQKMARDMRAEISSLEVLTIE